MPGPLFGFISNGLRILQLSGDTFGFFELGYQTLTAKYSEKSNRIPVFFSLGK